MNSDNKYEVQTAWGWFRLDEGAYRDYLEGKLWICSSPGGNGKKDPAAALPQENVSERALKLRELAAKSDAYSICCRFFPDCSVDIPYRKKMCDIPIDEMCLSVRSSNGLMRAGAGTFGKVKELMERENGLRSARNLGIKSEKEIRLSFFNSCYSLLSEQGKASWWQKLLDSNAEMPEES